MATASTASTDPPRRGPAQFYAGLLDRFCAIVGEGAGYATFHFAALQDGLERARETPDADLQQAVAMAAETLGHKAEVSEADDAILVNIWDCRMLERDARILEGILLGFYEGVVRAVTGAVHEGDLERGGHGSATLRLARKVH